MCFQFLLSLHMYHTVIREDCQRNPGHQVFFLASWFPYADFFFPWFPGFLILNPDPHQVFSKDRFALESAPALIQNIVLIANGVEVGEQELLAAGFGCYPSGKGWSEMPFDFSLI